MINKLFPDNTYRNDSGGDPLSIPDLTYEQLKQFHSRHYHPSNARYVNLTIIKLLELTEFNLIWFFLFSLEDFLHMEIFH